MRLSIVSNDRGPNAKRCTSLFGAADRFSADSGLVVEMASRLGLERSTAADAVGEAEDARDGGLAGVPGVFKNMDVGVDVIDVDAVATAG